MEQVHLKGKRHSGRAVRVSPLDSGDTSLILTAAARQMGPDAIFVELKKAEWREGIKLFVKQVSEPCEDPATAKFKKVTAQDMADLSQFFTPKDLLVLEAIYREYHDVSAAEVEAIVGKAVTVSED